MSFLLDTNVVSELARPRPDRGVVAWANDIARIELSVVTLEELWFGLSWKPNQRVQRWLETFVDEYCTVHPLNMAIAQCAGQLRGSLRASGQTRTQADMLIAATASVNAFTLVTRNTKDFVGCAIALLDPFTSQ